MPSNIGIYFTEVATFGSFLMPIKNHATDTINVFVDVVVVVIQFLSGAVSLAEIYPIHSAIARTPSLHLSHIRVCFFFKPIFSVSSSTCFV